jgi:hypothetical protein
MYTLPIDSIRQLHSTVKRSYNVRVLISLCPQSPHDRENKYLANINIGENLILAKNYISENWCLRKFVTSKQSTYIYMCAKQLVSQLDHNLFISFSYSISYFCHIISFKCRHNESTN